MANYPNLKVGLIFFRRKTSNRSSGLLSFNDADSLRLCKLSDKWIVVAGDINLMRDYKIWTHSDEDDDTKNDNIRAAQNMEDYAWGVIGDQLLDQPLVQSNIVELHLDSVFKDKATILSLELFKCVNVRVLSLRHNNLMNLPADVGRLSQLRILLLTENCLTYNTIPFTLTFCTHLKELYLDHNLLDALPGFLLDMPQLETVYRHGNHNYFKSTFMWYHTSERDRVMPLRQNKANTNNEAALYQPQSLEFFAIKRMIAAKINFFVPGLLPVSVRDHVAKVYMKYKICAYCSDAFYDSKAGFRVFTFKTPYLGNTCVPFEHWTCSRECGVALEEPAHKLERSQTRELDKQYQQYIRSIQEQFRQQPPVKNSCVVM